MKQGKKTDFQAILVYVVMLILVLFIALPPIFRIVLKEEAPANNTPQESITALICRRNVTLGQTQYNISTNSTYKEELERVTFSYQSVPVNETTQEETTPENPVVEQPAEQQPVEGTTETPIVETPQPQEGVVEETTTPQEDTQVVPPTEQTAPLTEASLQEEIAGLKAIPGIQVEEGENTTRLVLTKKAASSLAADSPYLNYFQKLENQRTYFESLGYTCSIVKN